MNHERDGIGDRAKINWHVALQYAGQQSGCEAIYLRDSLLCPVRLIAGRRIPERVPLILVAEALLVAAHDGTRFTVVPVQRTISVLETLEIIPRGVMMLLRNPHRPRCHKPSCAASVRPSLRQSVAW